MCHKELVTKTAERSSSPISIQPRSLLYKMESSIQGEPRRPSLETDYSRTSNLYNRSSSSIIIYTDNCEDVNARLPKSTSSRKRHLSSRNSQNNSRSKLSSGESIRSRGLSERDTNIFRFSHVEQPEKEFQTFGRSRVLPRISVYQDDEPDDVFEDITALPPPSCQLLLTPSTAHTPRTSSNRPSFSGDIGLGSSPNINLGILCNTPCRLRLEREGLSAERLVLGRGAYGTVVLGQYKGCKVAVKVMEKEEGGESARRRKSLDSELQALKLDHDNIVKVHGVFAAEERYAVIIMEYVGSRNLHRILIEAPEKVIGRSWLLGAALQISSALTHCHARGVIHLDIKPANILVTSSGTCKLGDFGCSAGLDSTSGLPLDHSLVGTPGYQAPEFLRGLAPQPPCDIYSLGILLWQLDSREVPFQGEHPQTIMFRTVSAGARPPNPTKHYIGCGGFSRLYKSCWTQDPVDRPTANIVFIRLTKIKTDLSMNRLNNTASGQAYAKRCLPPSPGQMEKTVSPAGRISLSATSHLHPANSTTESSTATIGTRKSSSSPLIGSLLALSPPIVGKSKSIPMRL